MCGREAMGSCSSAEVEDAGVEGRAGEGRGLERYVWGAAELGEGVWGCSQE